MKIQDLTLVQILMKKEASVEQVREDVLQSFLEYLQSSGKRLIVQKDLVSDEYIDQLKSKGLLEFVDLGEID